MRLLALDFGSVNIGVAVSDPLGLTAQGDGTIRRRSHAQDMAELKALVEEYQPRAFVLGLPLNMDGSRGPAVDRVQSFGSLLKQQFNLPVYYQDERLTTVAAQKTLLNNDTSRQKRRQVVDKLAATLILSTYLENPNNIK